MAGITIIGSGLGGIPMALEMKEHLRSSDELTVICNMDTYQFTPSNPWVAVGWRTRQEIEIPLAPIYKKRNINFIPTGAKRVLAEKNQVELADGRMVDYDYLIIATGPGLAYDEIEGLGPVSGFTQSICRTDHALKAFDAWQSFVQDPGPIVVGAVQGASCFGPAYEFAMIMETDLRRRKIRDKVPMTFVTSEPYIGHLGLGGVGDTKGLLESVMRERTIKWICNAKVARVEKDKVYVSELDETGNEKKKHELFFKYSMMLPAFKGIDAVYGIEGLVNPRGFVLINPYQQNPKYPNIFAIGVCVAIPAVEPTPVPTGVPKTGFMIESMVAATAHNIRALLDNKKPAHEATWNAVCLADFGDSGVGFVAIPQIPPRNVNWSSKGKHIHLAKVAFEKYFLHKLREGITETFYEKTLFKLLGVEKLKSIES
jgi:sulfide:quinone oxidoreductase